MKKKVIIPKDQAELDQWVDKLKAAGKPYTLVSRLGKIAIEVDEADALQVLGIQPSKKIPRGVRIFLWVVGALVVIAVLVPGDDSEKQAKEDAAVQVDSATLRKQMIDSQFSVWDGSHIAVTQAIKASMNDPKSYEHVETRFFDMKDHLVIKTKFRGKNAFGGVILGSVYAKVDLQGNILEISQE